jgi:hypothetical protein
MIARLTFIAALLAAPMVAAAQDAAPEPPTAEQLAAASAEAETLMSGSGAPELFTNVSSDGLAKVRHKASGLVCSFMPGAENNTLRLFDLGDDSPGDDVGCNADFGPLYLTYYATRYGTGYSAADSARDAGAAIRNRFPEARPYQGASATIQPPSGVGDLEYVGYMIGTDASPRYTHALTAKVGEWIFKQRMTADGGEDAVMSHQIMSAVFFNDVLEAAVSPDKP